MTELYLVRHGETEWSRTGRHTSFTDLDLTPTGEDQARALRDLLDPQSFDLVFCSPRLRARRTAELAGFTDYTVDEDLREWNYGDYEGLLAEEIDQKNPGWKVWYGSAPGGETVGQVAERLDRFNAKVRSSRADRVIAFAHGHALRALTTRWLGLPMTMGASLPLATGKLSVLGTYKGVPALMKWNS